MTNLNDRQRKTLIPLILEKQGRYACMDCNREPEELIKAGILPKLYVDHIDNDNSNNDLNNLQFLCVSCNTKKNHPSHEEPLDQRQTDPIFNTSKKNMERARQYVIGRMMDPGDKLEYHSLIDDMAEFLNNSQQANKNYLAKMTSKKHGLFEWKAGKNGDTFLYWKDDQALDQAVNSKF